jgi:phytoene dehydrogenase-like protein
MRSSVTLGSALILFGLYERSDAFILQPSIFRSNSPQNLHLTSRVAATSTSSATTTSATAEQEVDVVVIGSGIGGLSCAALSSKYNLSTLCVEAHSVPGGCAHSFSRRSTTNQNSESTSSQLFTFDSGPSLISGVSSISTNPLRQVLDAIGTSGDIDWCTYDGWMVHDLGDGQSFKLTTGDSGEFEKAIEKKEGKETRDEFVRFKNELLRNGGLTEISGYIPPFALRGDISAVRSMFSYIFKFLQIGTQGTLLTGPFSDILQKSNIQNRFLLQWFDYLAFALSGLDAAHTQAAPVAYTMGDLHRPNAVLDYPKGGMDSLIQALVNGLKNHGGELKLNTRVDKLLLEESEGGVATCNGVVLEDGTIVKARKGVVSNAPIWNLARIAEDSLDSDSSAVIKKAVSQVREDADTMEMTGSFMHLHLGIPADGIDKSLECHHSMLDFSTDVTAEQNLVIISIPTVFDPSLAPEGYHIVHAYTAASEDFKDWESLLESGKDGGKVGANPNSKQATGYNKDGKYDDLKTEKVEALWKAIEVVIPDVRERAKAKGAVSIIGTPLTHRRYEVSLIQIYVILGELTSNNLFLLCDHPGHIHRYNQRFRGTYGPAPSDGKDVVRFIIC